MPGSRASPELDQSAAVLVALSAMFTDQDGHQRDKPQTCALDARAPR